MRADRKEDINISPLAEEAPIMDIDIKFPLAVQLVDAKRTVIRIVGKKAELLLNFFLDEFWKVAIGSTKSVGLLDDYLSSHRSASVKFLNRCTRPAATSRLAL